MKKSRKEYSVLREKALDMYKSGMGCTKIGRELEVKEGTVRKWVWEEGISRPVVRHDREKLMELGRRWFEGESTKTLGAEIGVSANQLTHLLNKIGFKKKTITGFRDNAIELDDIESVPDEIFYVPCDKPIKKVNINGSSYEDISYQIMGY